MTSSDELSIDSRVRHRLWPELGVGTVVELTGKRNDRGDPTHAKVRWDDWGNGRLMSYDLGSLRKE